jgi:hypothetical protein
VGQPGPRCGQQHLAIGIGQRKSLSERAIHESVRELGRAREQDGEWLIVMANKLA